MAGAIPMLSYEDVGSAIDWLTEAFGFRESGQRFTDEDGRVTHAELSLDGATVFLGWPGPEYHSPAHHAQECEQAESPFDTAQGSLRGEDIENALASLPERDRKVIELRFGLSGAQPCTLEEVGRAFGVTRERIRQIENNTLKKLESLPEAQGLKDCV